jgi:peptidoglycan/xylan/chitin deacetylase (PgdA/CDA1 family)
LAAVRTRQRISIFPRISPVSLFSRIKAEQGGIFKMQEGEFVCLTYHDLGVPNEPAGRTSSGHSSYLVSGSAFASQMSYLRGQGLKGCKVSEALQGDKSGVALTFDDGTSSDIELAAPALSYAGFTATFYIVTSRVDRPGYLSRSDLRRLSDLGFEIGSRSVTNSFLPGLGPDGLRHELCDSKDQLEHWIGAPVSHFSCPFGGYTPSVIAAATEAGYISFATSQIGVNKAGAAVLRRVAVLRSTSLQTFERICAGKALMYPRVRQVVLSGLRSAIGFAAYSRLSHLGHSRQANVKNSKVA